MLNKVTPILLTLNEERNIARTLSRLEWARDIVVVDSGSTDQTLQIIRQFPNVRIFKRKFDSHADQWNYALKQTGVATEWVLALDADYRLSADLVEEISNLNPSEEESGFRVSFVYCIDGHPISGSLYPPVTVLYRQQGSVYFQDGHTQRICVSGVVRPLHSVILHDDRKPFADWLQSQEKYAALEADLITSQPLALLSWSDRIRKFIVFAPVLVPLYILFYKGAVKSGFRGFRYAGQRAIAEAVLSRSILRRILIKH